MGVKNSTGKNKFIKCYRELQAKTAWVGARYDGFVKASVWPYYYTILLYILFIL